MKSIKSVTDFLGSSAEDRNVFSKKKKSEAFLADIHRHLESQDLNSISTSLEIIRRLNLIETVPALFELIDAESTLNPFGDGPDPVSTIIELGSDAFNDLMDCAIKSSSDHQKRATAKIMFHWFLNEPDKMNELVKARAENAGEVERSILKDIQSQLDAYKKR